MPPEPMSGRRVAPADVGADARAGSRFHRHPAGPDGPRGRVRPGMGDSSYVSLDGRKMAPLLNPPPCH